MNRLHCPNCYSIKIIKKGKRKNSQRYHCNDCGKNWTKTSKKTIPKDKIWVSYAEDGLTKKNISKYYKISRRETASVIQEYEINSQILSIAFLKQVRTIIMDVTYLESRQHGIFVAIDAESGRTLYYKEIFWTERISDYELAILTLKPKLPALVCRVIDGRKGVREMILSYGILVQQC